MNSLSGFRILPVLMVFAAIAFGVRFSEFLQNFPYTQAQAAQAEQKLNAIEAAAGENVPAPSETDLSKGDAEAKTPEATTPAKPVVEAPSLGAAPAVPAAKEEWKGADDLDDEYSEVRMELFNDLSKRRKDLDAKEKELVVREALIKAAQAELTQKTQELSTIKTDIEALLKQQTEQEDQRIASLVKIYEGMKAKDAARIFDSLDMEVLLQVLTKMSERKSAPIIAAMDDEKARNVTIRLAEQNKLPALPELPVEQ